MLNYQISSLLSSSSVRIIITTQSVFHSKLFHVAAYVAHWQNTHTHMNRLLLHTNIHTRRNWHTLIRFRNKLRVHSMRPDFYPFSGSVRTLILCLSACICGLCLCMFVVCVFVCVYSWVCLCTDPSAILEYFIYIYHDIHTRRPISIRKRWQRECARPRFICVILRVHCARYTQTNTHNPHTYIAASLVSVAVRRRRRRSQCRCRLIKVLKHWKNRKHGITPAEPHIEHTNERVRHANTHKRHSHVYYTS